MLTTCNRRVSSVHQKKAGHGGDNVAAETVVTFLKSSIGQVVRHWTPKLHDRRVLGAVEPPATVALLPSANPSAGTDLNS
jgi:hypothetical protein